MLSVSAPTVDVGLIGQEMEEQFVPIAANERQFYRERTNRKHCVSDKQFAC
jgi:hypothetical protein